MSKTAKEYLDLLKKENDSWQRKLESIPGDKVNTNNQIYRMSVVASEKYYTAKRMMELMEKEAQPT